jgi:hypothetical protein
MADHIKHTIKMYPTFDKSGWYLDIAPPDVAWRKTAFHLPQIHNFGLTTRKPNLGSDNPNWGPFNKIPENVEVVKNILFTNQRTCDNEMQHGILDLILEQKKRIYRKTKENQV